MKYQKETLTKFADLIEQVAKDPENGWFKEELAKKLDLELSDIPDQISEVYEYCIQQIIQDQANLFYAGFNLTAIQSQLTEDFISMEGFRRTNEFQRFCIAVFQQIECIVNYLIRSTEIGEWIRRDWDQPCIHRFDRESRTFIRSGNQKLSSLIGKTNDRDSLQKLLDTNVENWTFQKKTRAVVYYFYFNAELKHNRDALDNVMNHVEDVKAIRDLVHRQSDLYPNIQAKVDRILPESNRYYLRFMGTLEDFVSNINASALL